MTTTASELAREREQAAAQLEAALVVAGAAYREFLRVSAALSDVLGMDLHQKLAIPILLHMSRAGFAALLERKVQAHGAPASLHDLVEQQHEARDGFAGARYRPPCTSSSRPPALHR